jgi:CheY-specific phosphatase CheX
MIEQLCLDEKLLESAEEIFETMIFMDLDKAEDQDSTIDDLTVLGSITFKGAMEGCLCIYCSDSCTRAITMNMLGLETSEDISNDDISDAVGEVCNMVMGCLKKRLIDSVGNLDLSIPTVVNGTDITSSVLDNAKKTSVNINIDEYTAELSLLYRENQE